MAPLGAVAGPEAVAAVVRGLGWAGIAFMNAGAAAAAACAGAVGCGAAAWPLLEGATVDGREATDADAACAGSGGALERPVATPSIRVAVGPAAYCCCCCCCCCSRCDWDAWPCGAYSGG